MAPNGLLSAFLGALQASLSVLLIIFYGVIATQFKLLDGHSATYISKICVRMFLPALLITNVGAELHIDTAIRYVPVLIWSIAYTLISTGIGIIGTRFLKLPQWVTPAISFNNTTSLPLLLIQALDATGILSTLVIGDESTSEAIKRAKSYFLVCAIVGNSMTFALGPRLLDAESAPESASKEEEDDDDDNDGNAQEQDGYAEQEQNGGGSTEHTSLLPSSVRNAHVQAYNHSYGHGKKYWDQLHPNVQWGIEFMSDFFNAPLIGALIGALIGLIPPLHRAFFSSQQEGGFFNAWLTTSISNIGELFASLQTVVVGVSLSSSLRKLKRGENSGNVPLTATLFIIVVRFILWPVISIAFIWMLATRTNLLGDDPMLWFTMMLMPTGPPAMKLVAMSEVNGADEEEKMAVSKILAITYAVTPLICFAVVGSLKASQAAI